LPASARPLFDKFLSNEAIRLPSLRRYRDQVWLICHSRISLPGVNLKGRESFWFKNKQSVRASS
jgi:hypothetical protein